jgi:hypothetical protein
MGGPLEMVDKLAALHYDGGRGRNRWDCVGSYSPTRTCQIKKDASLNRSIKLLAMMSTHKIPYDNKDY